MRQPVHVVDVVVFALGVLGFLVVPAAAREVRRRVVGGSGQRTISDAITIHIFIAGKAAKLLEILRGKNFAALIGPSG
jgi:hypothetical protein